MSALKSNNDRWPLHPRSLECRLNLVRASQKAPLKLVHQRPNSLACRLRAPDSPFRQVRNPESGAAKTNQSP
jgi:hypothetical protein